MKQKTYELLKDQHPGLKTEYITPHVCGHCMAHIAADWIVCPECGTPTGLCEEEPADKNPSAEPNASAAPRGEESTDNAPAKTLEEELMKMAERRQMQYPITVDNIEFREPYSLYQPALVRVRPCGDEKTYLGFLCGDMPNGQHASYDPQTRVLSVSMISNPAIFVPDLMKVVWGYESWWSRIQSSEDIKDISDEHINSQWYMKLMRAMRWAETSEKDVQRKEE